MVRLTAGTFTERREETEDEAGAAILYATLESAYLIGFTQQEMADHTANDPELREIRKKVKEMYQAAEEPNNSDYSLF
jgi:hypothetical protein